MPATRVNARHVGPQVAVVHHGKCSRPRGKMRLNCMRGELEQTEQTRTNSNKPSVPCSTRVSWPHHGARFPTTPFLTILVVFRVALVDFPLLISTLPRIPPSPCGLPAGHCPPSATDARVERTTHIIQRLRQRLHGSAGGCLHHAAIGACIGLRRSMQYSCRTSTAAASF